MIVVLVETFEFVGLQGVGQLLEALLVEEPEHPLVQDQLLVELQRQCGIVPRPLLCHAHPPLCSSSRDFVSALGPDHDIQYLASLTGKGDEVGRRPKTKLLNQVRQSYGRFCHNEFADPVDKQRPMLLRITSHLALG